MKDIEGLYTKENIIRSNVSRRGLVDDGPSEFMKYAVWIIAVVAAVLGFGNYYFYSQYHKALSADYAAAQDETDQVENQVRAKISDLPDKRPVMATVSDSSQMKDQLFFSEAEDGDRVLVYLESQKAVLWRPSEKQVIQETPINFEVAEKKDDKKDQDQKDQAPTGPVTVTVLNGTRIKGLAADMAGKLTGITNINIVSKSNATKDYTENLVVDLSGKNADVCKAIADKLGGKVGELPRGESNPKTDILVIAGKK